MTVNIAKPAAVAAQQVVLNGGVVHPDGADADLKIAQGLYKGADAGYRPYPSDVLLPFEFTPDVKAATAAGHFEPIHQLNLTLGRIGDARKLLDGVEQANIPTSVDGMKLPENSGLADALRGAHYAVSNSLENRAHFHADGTMFEADAANAKIVTEMSAEDYLNTVVYRLKATDVGAIPGAHADSAIMKGQKFGDLLTYNKSDIGHPNLKGAKQQLDEMEKLVMQARDASDVDTAGMSTINKVMNHLQQLSAAQSKAVLIGSVVGAALIGGTIGWLVAKD